MYLSIKNLTVALIIFISLKAYAADFEGKISMVKESYFETSFFNYYISKNNIRIEELDSHKQLKEVLIINLYSQEVFLLQPGNEVYTKLKKNKKQNAGENNFEIKKTQNYKLINGEKCVQWRVKNKSRNSEFAYWVTQNDFDFFVKMVKVLNQYDCNWEFFDKIPGYEGFFPIMSEERNLVRDKKMTTEVLQIKRKRIEKSMFYIPTDYKYLTI